MTPNLTESEIAEICAPLKMGNAQFNYLSRLGMIVRKKPNGRPLVARGEFERVMIGRQTEATISGTQPNVVALMSLVNQRKGARHGSPA